MLWNIVKCMREVIVVPRWVDLDVPTAVPSEEFAKAGVVTPAKTVVEGLVAEQDPQGRRGNGEVLWYTPLMAGIARN